MMRLSFEHFGKLLIIGTQLDITERMQMVKKTQELIAKRELAMKVSNIIHWDFDVRTQEFEAYNDPINDYASDKLVSIQRYMDVIHPEDRSSSYDAIQSMLSGKELTINFTCRMQTKYDESWQYCNIIGVPFEKDEYGNNVRYTGFRQNISKLHQLNEELEERNYKMQLTFKTVGMSYWDFEVKSKQFKAFNDPVNDFHSENAITPEDYLHVTHPEDIEQVRNHINYMIGGTTKDLNFKFRSKTKWDKEWQTLIVTGIPVERDKKGNVIRYTGIKVNNTKWEKMAQQLKELKDKAGETVSAIGEAVGGADSKLNGVSNFLREASGGGLFNMLSGFLRNLGGGNVSGLNIAGLIAAAYLVFGRFGWLGKIAGLFLGMMLIGNNAGVVRTVPSETVSRTQTPTLSPEEQTQSGGMRR